jgi:5-methyltetrahydrofolate--homocysteine methyltransferase
MSIFHEKIEEKGILLSDGAWGTYLLEKGLPAGHCPELWNVTQEETVYSIAKGYCDLGVDLIGTNSFGGSRFKLKLYGMEERVYELNQAAAKISRSAAGDDILVLGSMGPTGKILMTGEVSESELTDSFTVQAQALEAGGVDAACIETMTDLDEALCAIRAVQENTQLEIACTFTFEETLQGEFRTMMGVSPAEMTEVLLNQGVAIIGANCGNGIKGMIPIVQEIRQVTKEVPVLVHANAGIPILKDGETHFCESPEEMASRIPELIDAGATIIGGCCGTTTAHIAAIKNALPGSH